MRTSSFSRHLLGHEPSSDLAIVGKCPKGNFQPFKGTLVSHLEKYLNGNEQRQIVFAEIDTFFYISS